MSRFIAKRLSLKSNDCFRIKRDTVSEPRLKAVYCNRFGYNKVIHDWICRAISSTGWSCCARGRAASCIKDPWNSYVPVLSVRHIHQGTRALVHLLVQVRNSCLNVDPSNYRVPVHRTRIVRLVLRTLLTGCCSTAADTVTAQRDASQLAFTWNYRRSPCSFSFVRTNSNFTKLLFGNETTTIRYELWTTVSQRTR